MNLKKIATAVILIFALALAYTNCGDVRLLGKGNTEQSSQEEPTPTPIIPTPTATPTVENPTPTPDTDIDGNPIPVVTEPGRQVELIYERKGCRSEGPGPCGAYEVPKTNCPADIEHMWQLNVNGMWPGNWLRFAMKAKDAISIKFKPSQNGFDGSLYPVGFELGIPLDAEAGGTYFYPGVIGVETGSSVLFATISKTRCDFSYQKLDNNDPCAKTNYFNTMAWEVTLPGVTDPMPGQGYAPLLCPVGRDEYYYLNIKFEDARSVQGRGQNSCLAGGTQACIVHIGGM